MAVNTLTRKLTGQRELYRHYLNHAARMLAIEDLHGLWDAAVNASEVSNKIDGLEEALAALGVNP